MTRLLAATLLAFALGTSTTPANPANEDPASEANPEKLIEEGREFRRVLPTQPTAVPPGQVEVIEFFWYGCPHCFRSEPHIEKWLESKPENVVFTRVPATLNQGWVLLARAYYAAEELGVLEVMHEALFEAFHVNPRMLGSEERLADYFKEKVDVSEEDFRAAFNSMRVTSRVQRADLLARRYRIAGVPAMAVNGKYITDPEQARGYSAMLETVDTLARWELQQQAE